MTFSVPVDVGGDDSRPYRPQTPAFAATWKTTSHPSTASVHRRRVGEVAEHLLDAEFVEPRVVRLRVNERTVSPRACRSRHDRPAEEPAAAGDEGFHAGPPFQFGPRLVSSAHTASFSRKIFELCRTSTGKSGCSKKRLDATVVISIFRARVPQSRLRCGAVPRPGTPSTSPVPPNPCQQRTGYVIAVPRRRRRVPSDTAYVHRLKIGSTMSVNSVPSA